MNNFYASLVMLAKQADTVFSGSQCGFCTPGIVMSLYAVIRNSYYDGAFHLTNSDLEMKGHLDGNLCRCVS